MKCEEAGELVTALVDNELSSLERAAIEAHLKNCSSCELLYQHESALKNEMRRAAATYKAPGRLKEKILNDRRIFPRRPVSESRPAWGLNIFLRPAFAAALLVLLALPAVYLMRPVAAPPSLSALEVHEKIIGGELSFIRGGSPEEIKETLYRSVAGAFAPMTYDLTALKLKAVGGTVREFDGRKVLVTIYEGDGLTLTCYTFLGTEDDAPPAAERFYDAVKKINFYTYSRGGINAVLHREGNLICILVSPLPASQLLSLARSNA